jgi:hypothetical protein
MESDQLSSNETILLNEDFVIESILHAWVLLNNPTQLFYLNLLILNDYSTLLNLFLMILFQLCQNSLCLRF